MEKGPARIILKGLHNKDAPREQGIVKWYNHQKQYGFITSLQCDHDYFVHRDDLNPKFCTAPILFTGEYVEYNRVHTEDGRIKASNVQGISRGPLMCDHGKMHTHTKVVELTTKTTSCMPY